jgi:hypothetical protein
MKTNILIKVLRESIKKDGDAVLTKFSLLEILDEARKLEKEEAIQEEENHRQAWEEANPHWGQF